MKTKTTTAKLDMSHVRAIIRHLNPVATKAGKNNDFALRFASETESREAITLLRARGYSAGFGATALDVTGE